MTWRHRDSDDDRLVDGHDVEFIVVSISPPHAASWLHPREAIRCSARQSERRNALDQRV
jgi:hypothetical protein